jgi:hypothetical protein
MTRAQRLTFFLIALLAIGTFLFGVLVLAGALKH